MRNPWRLILIGQLLSFSAWGSALTDWLDKLETFQGDYTQSIYDGSQVVATAAGHLSLKRPSQFRWEQTEPDQLIVLADGQHLWTYDVLLEQVIKQPQAQSIANTPLGFMLDGAKSLNEMFTVNQTQAEPSTFTLIPKQADSPYQSITLEFKDNQLYRMRSTDQLGQTIEVLLSNVVRNTPIRARRFQLNLPDEIDLIEMDAS